MGDLLEKKVSMPGMVLAAAGEYDANAPKALQTFYWYVI